MSRGFARSARVEALGPVDEADVLDMMLKIPVYGGTMLHAVDIAAARKFIDVYRGALFGSLREFR